MSGGDNKPPGFCAICDSTNLTTRLCRACRKDPANAGWSEHDLATPSSDVAELAERALRDLSAFEGPLQPVPPGDRAILGLLYLYALRAPERPRGRQRGKTEWCWRARTLTLEEIGFLIGKSRQAVGKRLQHLLAPWLEAMTQNAAPTG